jgi:myo-inositol catabolism protein IolC
MLEQLFLLAFDHRRSLMESFFDVRGEPTPEDEANARLLKLLVWKGLTEGIGHGISRDQAGALVDATHGREVIVAAQRDGVRVATPIEESGRSEFAFQTPGWREQLDELDPTWAKVLVRYNPEGDTELNARQRRALVEVSDHCRASGRGFLFELLVPPEPHQLDGSTAARYDVEVRPDLMVRAIAELQQAGIEPDIWKIEGLDRSEDCEAVAVSARAGGRDSVGCVVLGRGADTEAVDRWLRAAAGVTGFIGFAIGRSIWWDATRAYVDGSSDRDATVTAIAERYGHFVDVFHAAA